MPDLTPDHPAVEAAALKYLNTRRGNGVHDAIAAALTAALPYLTAEHDAYREENTRLREQAARVKALADRLDAEAADDFDGVSGTSVSLVKYETAKAIRAALNGETNG